MVEVLDELFEVVRLDVEDDTGAVLEWLHVSDSFD